MATYYSFTDAAGATKYIKIVSGDGSTGDPYQALAHTGATDDAAAAGQIYPMAGMYQTTIDEVDAGDVGRLRMSVRRGLITSVDYLSCTGTEATVANIGDITVSTGGGYAAPTTAFFDGTDVGFTASARYIKIPMAPQWRECSIAVFNSLGVNITCAIGLWLTTSIISNMTVASQTLSSSTSTAYYNTFAAEAGGVGAAANYFPVPALKIPTDFITIAVTPAGDPSTGALRIIVNRRS